MKKALLAGFELWGYQRFQGKAPGVNRRFGRQPRKDNPAEANFGEFAQVVFQHHSAGGHGLFRQHPVAKRIGADPCIKDDGPPPTQLTYPEVSFQAHAVESHGDGPFDNSRQVDRQDGQKYGHGGDGGEQAAGQNQ